MKHADKWFFYVMISGLVLLFGAMMFIPAQPAAAQCGTSASSCKNCHETQGKMPVANNGDWHKSHAFGDFCEFCHAGNVQATAKEEAHVGMVPPLGDVQASCQGCHPDDYDPLALGYASTLGIDLGAGGETSGGGAAPAATSGGDSADCTPGVTAVSAPLGGEEIDYNLLYAETTSPPLVTNWGNISLLLLTLGVTTAFFLTAWSWEGWGQKVAGWINHNVNPIPQAVTAAAARVALPACMPTERVGKTGVAASDSGGAMTQALAADNPAQVQTLLAQKPELRRLLPKLMNLPPETLSALDTILANPEQGSDLLQAVSQIESETMPSPGVVAEVIAALRQLGAKDRNLLLALFKE
jgi:hypothetical protein